MHRAAKKWALAVTLMGLMQLARISHRGSR